MKQIYKNKSVKVKRKQVNDSFKLNKLNSLKKEVEEFE